MNKKIITISILSIVAFSACSSSLQIDIPELSEEQQQKYQDLIAEQKEILKETPKSTKALFNIAYSHQLLGNYNDAIKTYDGVLKIDPKHFPSLNNAADIYERAGKYDKSAKYIKTLYENNPDNSAVLKDTIRILLLADEPNNAQDALDNFISITRGTAKEESTGFISNLYESIRNHENNHE